jgi:hypothetical protein
MTGRSVEIKAKLEPDIVLFAMENLLLKAVEFETGMRKFSRKILLQCWIREGFRILGCGENWAGYSLRPLTLVLLPKLQLMFLA